MDPLSLVQEIIALYERHGWELRRALLTTATNAVIGDAAAELLRGTKIIETDVDALWFARPSPGGREAWELRLIAEQPYALFETFESDEAEEDREDARREIENRIREYAGQ